MLVLLDEQALSVERASLAAALSAAQSLARARGRIIVEVRADGRPIADELLASPSDELVDIKRIELKSAEPRALVAFTLTDAAEALEQVALDHEDVGRAIQSGQTQEALGRLSESIATWQAVCDILAKSAALLKLDLDALRPSDGVPGTISERFAALHERLGAMKSALETQDFSALSDILLYDLAPKAREWSGLLREIASLVRGGSLGAEIEES